MNKDKDKDSLSSKQMLRFRCHVIDWVLSLFVFYPSMLCYWRGIWDLYTFYFSSINPKEEVYLWLITAMGSCFIFFYIIYPLVNRLIADLPNLLRAIIVRFTLYCGGVFAMGYWRGVWGLFDYYFQMNWQSGVIGLAVSYPILVLLKASRSIIFPPFVVTLDSRSDALIPGTRFQSRLRLGFRNIVFYILDSLFTHFFILTLTILAWRSMLTLFSLIPSPPGMNDFICFGVGIFAVIIIFMLEIPFALAGRKLVSGMDWPSEIDLDTQAPPISNPELNPSTSRDQIANKAMFLDKLSRYFTLTPRQKAKLKLHLYEDLIFVFIFVSEAFLWLGGWNLNATYIIPDRKLGGWINHAIGSFLLLTLGLMTFGGYSGCGSDDPNLASVLENGMPLHVYPIRFIRSIVEDTNDESDSSAGVTTTSSSDAPISIAFVPDDCFASSSSLAFPVSSYI